MVLNVVVPIKERLSVETLVVMIMSIDANGIKEYEEIVGVLYVNGSYDYAPKKLDLDLKNKTTTLAHPSIEE